MTHQTCTTCGETKLLAEFYKRQSDPPKYKTQCKTCFGKRQQAYQKTPAGREVAKKTYKKWRAENLELARKLSREGNKQARKTDPRRFKSYDLKRRYGIPLEQYEALLAAQHGTCAICCAPEPGGRGMFHVDHCHTSLKIRGLLCTHCNAGLGQFKDSPERLEAAIHYLTQK